MMWTKMYLLKILYINTSIDCNQNDPVDQLTLPIEQLIVLDINHVSISNCRPRLKLN